MARNMLTGIAYDVTETYAYSGRMGRVSSRVTALTKGGAANESWTLGVDYDEYGLPSSIDYPTCAGAGCRTGSGAAYNVTFGRADGMLTSIPNWTGGTITYHPNLMVASVPHANGSTETIANDPDGLARPLSIQGTAKVSGAFTAEWKTGTYAFDGAGNVMSMTDGTKIDKFKYDKVSRLTGSTLGSLATSRSQNYAFDLYGNITSITTDGVAVNTPTSAATNRLNATGTTYDPRGSLTAWNGQSYAWDQFRVLKERCTSGTIGACTGTGAELWRYAYTADGERVLALKSDSTKEIWTLRGLDNKVLRRDDTGVLTSYVYRDDRSFGSIDSTGKIQHFATDHLGTIRLTTSSTGTKLAEHTYFPFGEEATATTQDSEVMKFTAHERDLASSLGTGDDLDYMHARQLGLAVGRFLSVDAEPGDIDDPQSLNRYVYALGNPLLYVDPDGDSPIKYLIKGLNGAYRLGKRSSAVSAASKRPHAVTVKGRGASQEARRVAREGNPDQVIVRHDPHRVGDLPHYQPKKGGKGHVHYDPESIVVAMAALGGAAASEVEAATGSALLGRTTGFLIDFVNPAQDIQLGAELLEEVGTDLIEAAYDVESNDEADDDDDIDSCEDPSDGCENDETKSAG